MCFFFVMRIWYNERYNFKKYNKFKNINERDIIGWYFYQTYGKRKADGRVLIGEAEEN